MTSAQPRHAHAFAVVVVTAILAACSGGAGTSGPGASGNTAGGPTPAGTAGPAGTTQATSAAGGGTIAACSLLTEADIKEITGFRVAKVIPNPPDTIFPSACEWHVQDAAWQIVLGVSSPGGQAQWSSLVPYTQGKAVTGVGDEAFLAEMGEDLMVRRGDTFIDVQYVAAGQTDDIQERLAKRVLEHLP